MPCGQAGAAPAQAPEHICRGREHVLLASLEGDPGLASLGLREVHALRQAPPRQCPRGRQRPPHWPAVKAIPTVLTEKTRRVAAAVSCPESFTRDACRPCGVPSETPAGVASQASPPPLGGCDSRACLCGALNGSHFDLARAEMLRRRCRRRRRIADDRSGIPALPLESLSSWRSPN